MAGKSSYSDEQVSWLLEHDSIYQDRTELATKFNKKFKTQKTKNSLQCKIVRLRGNAPKEVAVKAKKPVPEGGHRLGIVMSDIHYGSLVKDQNGRVTYNVEICEEKIAALPAKMQAEAPPYDYDGAVVLMVGDMVDGEAIYPSHRGNLDVTPLEQVAGVSKCFYKMLGAIADIYGHVSVYCVPGNHGRTGFDRDERSNWDLVCYQQLQLRASMDEDRDIKVHVSYRDGGLFDVCGVKFYMRHIGIKHDATPSARSKLGSWYEKYGYDIFVCGHFHRAGILSYNGKPVLRNGAGQPLTDYGDKLALHDPPKQIVFGLSNKRLTFTHFLDY